MKFFKFENLEELYGAERFHKYLRRYFAKHVDAPGVNSEKAVNSLYVADILLGIYRRGHFKKLDDLLKALEKRVPHSLFGVTGKAALKATQSKRPFRKQGHPKSIVALVKFFKREIEKNPDKRRSKSRNGKKPKLEIVAEAVQRELRDLGLGEFVQKISTVEKMLKDSYGKPSRP